MAQPIFDEHPLEQYLRDAGEVYEPMPGASQELIEEIDIHCHIYSPEEDEEELDMEWRPQCVVVGLNILQTFLSSAKPSTPSNPFVERFKYNVISSSLLSSSLSGSHSSRSSQGSIPGRLSHSPSNSLDLKSDGAVFAYSSTQHHGLLSFAALATAVFVALGSRFMATLCLAGLSFLAYHSLASSESPTHDFTPTFTSLDELVSASTAWESTVQEALQLLEKDESNSNAASSSSNSYLNSLRISLHTTLQTTRTQCDNVRQLFSALTCPSELSQLSEMYAPPSPIKSPLSLSGEPSPRPYSFPTRHSVTSPNPTTPQNKRSTWHASYAGLASAGSPTTNLFRRREKHRSAVSNTLFQDPKSAPVTPSPLSPIPGYGLSQIAESVPLPPDECMTSPFGPGALGLQAHSTRKPQAILSPQPDRLAYSSRTFGGVVSNSTPITTMSSASRFTTVATQAPRQYHPLSLFTLTQTLQGAVSAKRYTCAHLLALRFGEDEEEYWENVRSMMELLTSTFGDEAARLGEALEDVERLRLRDQNPTPDTSVEIEGGLGMGVGRRSRAMSVGMGMRRWSFAPMPSHVSRFSAHVDAIMAALDDAREHLQDCVESLKDGADHSPLIPDGHNAENEDEEQEHRAIMAYERLRKELGMALRECERGKQNLLDIVHPPPVASSSSDDDDDDENSGVPGLEHDPSDDSDNKPDPVSPSEDEDERSAVVVDAANGEPDDATSHLLMSTSIQHLPPQGIEQVYEADTSNVTPFTRERSKMSREERIKMIRAKRESAAGSAGDGLGLLIERDSTMTTKVERWGPGGEVVQELKDVIWKLGEKRRKMQERQQQQHQVNNSAHSRPPMPTFLAAVAAEDLYYAMLPPLPESPLSPSPPSSPSPSPTSLLMSS